MPYGYHGKILRVDLGEGKVWVEEKEEEFYRRYMGGGAMGAYYILNNVKPGTDAFDPGNIMFFGGSVVTGARISGFTRHTVCSISPLTGGIADSEAGGYWARGLKAAGFDAVVVQGCSPEPVYLWINNGSAEIKPASHLWGKTTGEAQGIIRNENDDNRARVLGIGQAGENKVRFACIINELRSANGRAGLGAVMGSKKLKAIAVRGNIFPEAADDSGVKKIAQEFNAKFRDTESGFLTGGTGQVVSLQNEGGQLPSFNWRTGYFDKAGEICGSKIKKTIFANNEGCYACSVNCKKAVKAEEPYVIDPKYGGPEYESLATLGSYTGVSDMYAVCKANELCNRYSLDTISTGAVIAFAMDCYENGILTDKDTDGLEVRFGNAEVLLQLIEKLARREGFGNMLAEGSKRMAEKLGPKAKDLAVHCKGVEFPAHEPRVKTSLALAYGTVPIGADHMASEHDISNAPDTPDFVVNRGIKPLGIGERLELNDLGYKKVRFYYYTAIYYSMLNCLDICHFCVAPARALEYKDIVNSINAITGWDTNFWELMLVGNRRLQMMRAFNMAAGMTREDDMLPKRMFEPMENCGNVLDEEEYCEALDLYYKFIGWDDTGKPKKSKLYELDLDWVAEKVPAGISADF